MKRPPRIRPDSYPPAAWRLLRDPPADGATNMAVDEAVLESVAAGDSPPTLRLYAWEPAALSLGRAQEWDVIDYDAAASLGWDVVRRATGGRAILHTDELTYSVAAPESEPRVAGGVLESYQRLSEALLLALKELGLEPQRAQAVYTDQGEAGPACFDGPSQYEITIGQRKLIGSAQVRRHHGILQHGTLPLRGDITRITQGLWVDMPGQRMAIKMRLRYRATTLEESLGHPITWEEAAAVFTTGFANALNLTLEPGSLTLTETERAAQLRREKYADEAWLKRR